MSPVHRHLVRGAFHVPLDFLKRKGQSETAEAPTARPSASSLLPEEVVAQDHILKLYYAGKSSDGARLKAGPAARADPPPNPYYAGKNSDAVPLKAGRAGLRELPTMLVGLAQSPVEVVEPLPIE